MFRKKFAAIFILLAFTLFAASGCSNSEVKGNGDNRILVYASIYPMYDFAKNIGKDKIDLRLMVTPGAEAHDFEPTAKLMGSMEKADVFIYNGLEMEPWAAKLIGSLDNEKLVKVEASEGVELIKSEEEAEGHGEEVEEKHGEYDPHVWLNPQNAVIQAENIKNALISADEKNKDFYEANFKEFKEKLVALDNKYTEELKGIKKREFVTAHSAFTYLAKKYNLEQESIKGLSPQAEPSMAKMAELSVFAKEHEVKYIFFETTTNPKLSEALAKEVGAQTAVLNPLESLGQEDINSGKNYISVMEENLKTLKMALGE